MSAAKAVAVITSNVMALVSSDHLSIDIACNTSGNNDRMGSLYRLTSWRGGDTDCPDLRRASGRP